MKRLKHETSGEKYQPGAQEPGGDSGGSLLPQLWSRGAVPPQLFIGLGTVRAVASPN